MGKREIENVDLKKEKNQVTYNFDTANTVSISMTEIHIVLFYDLKIKPWIRSLLLETLLLLFCYEPVAKNIPT